MTESNIIPILVLLPILGALVTLLGTPKGKPKLSGPIALVCSLFPLAVVIWMVASFPALGPQVRSAVEKEKSPILTGFSSVAEFGLGQSVSGAGIPDGTTVTTVDPVRKTVTLSASATATGAQSLTFAGGWFFCCTYEWISNLGVRFLMGVDAISLWLIVLTAVLTPVSILASFQYIKERQPEFYAWMLMLHAGMLGVFAARDILVFYLFFEFTLIPMFFIIGIWGGVERRRAAGKFFLFTFAGSVLTLASLIYIAYMVYLGTGRLSFAMDDLYKYAPHITGSLSFDLFGYHLSIAIQTILFFGLLAGFAVKVPLFPVHTWLPLAHTEAPTAGSVILAGVLLKLGTYGILRFMLPVLPDATRAYAPWIAGVCIVGIVYGALVSWVQGDMKKLIAYSSVSHLGFCVLGMFALTYEGLTGSILYMLNHGLSTGALFLVVGMIYERYHTRDMNQVGGIVRRVPALAFFAVFFVLSSVALPGLNGFVSEFLVLLGTFVSGRGHLVNGYQYGSLGPAFAIPAATGVILGAVYLLYWTGRVIFGPLREPAHEPAHHDEDADASHGGGEGHAPVKDLSLREWVVLVPIAVLVLYMGVYPKLVIGSLEKPVARIADSLRVDQNPGSRTGVAGKEPVSPAAASVAAK